MELMSKLRWIFLVLIMLFVLIFAGWALSAIARNIFDGGNDTVVEEISENNLAGVAVARYTVDGPVVASSEHRSYTIEVSENVVTMRVFSDYGQEVFREKSYRNNSEAFNTFMESLEKADATVRIEGTTVEDDFDDKGVCPTGLTYILELDDAVRRWTTSCDRDQGTAAGKMTTMRTLFADQVPDFADLVEGTGLNTQ